MRKVSIAVVFAAAILAGCDALSQPSKDAAVYYYVQGQMLADKGDEAAALEELAKAIKADPSLSIAHSAVGDIHRKMGNYEMARRAYESACKANPYAFKPQYNLGVTYQILAETAKAATSAQECLRQAVTVYVRALTIDPDDFDANLNLSACYFQQGKYDLAEQYCQAAIKINPKSPQAFSNLGIIYDSQNRLYEAVNAYKASLELDTHQPTLLINMGQTYIRQGRHKAAIHVFELAAKEAPTDAAPWEQIGACCFTLRQMPQALSAYENAAKINPKSAVAHRGIGVVCMSQFVQDASRTELRDRGLAEWNTSLDLDPGQDDLKHLVTKYTPKPAPPQL
jgi:tetratricopeptide (TPR) repeat protein